MLLRRMAGSEEVVPTLYLHQLITSSAAKEIEDSVRISLTKVGEQSVLFMAFFWCCLELQQVSSPVDFKVIERTKLGSLSEGFIYAPSYFVTSSSCPESKDIDKTELNAQIFQELCSVLHSLARQVSLPVNFKVIERTNLGSPSQGVIFSPSYVVTPSSCAESEDIDNSDEDIDKSELSAQFFQGLCKFLSVLLYIVTFRQRTDASHASGRTEAVVPTLNVRQLVTSSAAKVIQDFFPRTLYCATFSGPCLVCSSNFEIEMLKQTSFECYFILLPSDKGLMLLRRLAGSKEVVPTLDVLSVNYFSRR
ncbi:hypothetical protein POM88_051320 [Heracleum sosnowskyi]|uniref:Uncharacterized protein n=1 Tax=Heracleum sosnowskyi TaxID=360622 RepID=A0AAD8H1J6_9APIA|nr:hypothetical protein POM88_051320 [Heracleum sosnowskyi]